MSNFIPVEFSGHTVLKLINYEIKLLLYNGYVIIIIITVQISKRVCGIDTYTITYSYIK